MFFLKGVNILICLQVLSIFTEFSAASSPAQQPKLVEQTFRHEINETGGCQYQIRINVKDIPPEKLDALESAFKPLEAVLNATLQIDPKCASKAGLKGYIDSTTHHNRIKEVEGEEETGNQQEVVQEGGTNKSMEWLKEGLNIPNNITELCSMSTATCIVSSTSSNKNKQIYRCRKLWSSSGADPLPWMSIDLGQTRRIYFITPSVVNNYRFNNIKLFYGTEKKEGWEILNEALFDSFDSFDGYTEGSQVYFRPKDAYYVEGRYFYVIKYPNESILETSISCYGI